MGGLVAVRRDWADNPRNPRERASGPEQAANTLAEMVYRGIRVDILLCKLTPGSKLRIAELAAVYGVSGGVIREGLCRLASAGLVNWEEQRGFSVAQVSVDDLLDLTKNRIWVETHALRLAMRRGDRDWEAEILAASHRLGTVQPWRSKDNPEDLDENWVRCHRAFHRALVLACGSAYLLQTRDALHDMCDRYKRVAGMTISSTRNLAGEHQALLTAVLDRDEERAGELIEGHFLQSVGANLITLGGTQASARQTMTALKQQIREARQGA
jgi:GntR family transcriptional regulator, carbon starvation induced regulator